MEYKNIVRLAFEEQGRSSLREIKEILCIGGMWGSKQTSKEL